MSVLDSASGDKKEEKTKQKEKVLIESFASSEIRFPSQFNNHKKVNTVANAIFFPSESSTIKM